MMDDPAPNRPAPVPLPADQATEHAAPDLQERFPFSTKEIIRQIYFISGAVIVLLSLAIWLMMSLS